MVKVYGRRARWLLPWLFVVACVVPRPAPRPPAVIKVGSIRVEELRLKSGLRILVQPDSSRPLVATALVIGTGSADDPRGQEGLAHFVEHLTYHARDASGTLRKDALWRLGVSFNAFTSQDETIYSALGSSDAISLRAMLRTELERLATPLAGVPADLVPRERGVIEAEIDEVADAPHGPVYSRLTALAFPVGHPYERPSGGTPESRGRIGLAEAQRFCTTHYVPTNATLVVAGDVTTDGLVAHLHDLMPDSLKASTDQPRKVAPGGSAVVPDAATSAGRTLVRPVEAPTAFFVWALPPSPGRDRWVSRMAALALNVELGRVSMVDGDMVPVSCSAERKDRGDLLVCVASLFDHAYLDKARAKVNEALHMLATSALADQRTRRLRPPPNMIPAMMFPALEPLSARAAGIAREYRATGAPDPISAEVEAARKMDVSRVQQTLRTFVTAERMRMLYVRPPDEPGETLSGMPAPRKVVGVERLHGGSLGSLAAQLAGPRLPPKAAARPIAWQSTSLPSGLRVLATRVGDQPTVSATLWLPSGRATPPLAGVGEVALELSYRTWSRYALATELTGAGVTHSVTDEDTRFTSSGPSALLPNMLEDLARAVSTREASNFAVTRFQRDFAPYLERSRKHADASPARTLRRMLLPNADASVGHLISGKPLGFGVSDVEAWIERALVPDGAVLVLAGDLDTAVALAQAREAFDRWKGKRPDVPAILWSGPSGRSTRHLARERAQAEVLAGCLLPFGSTAERAARTLAADYLGATLNEWGRGAGLSYGADAAVVSWRTAGDALWVSGRMAPAALGPFVDTLDAALAGELQPELLSRLAQRRVRALTQWMESTRATVASAIEALARGADPVAEAVSLGPAYEAVRPDQVMSVLRHCKDNLRRTVAGPRPALAAVQDR